MSFEPGGVRRRRSRRRRSRRSRASEVWHEEWAGGEEEECKDKKILKYKDLNSLRPSSKKGEVKTVNIERWGGAGAGGDEAALM